MTVGEFINKLQAFDASVKVTIEDQDLIMSAQPPVLRVCGVDGDGRPNQILLCGPEESAQMERWAIEHGAVTVDAAYAAYQTAGGR